MEKTGGRLKRGPKIALIVVVALAALLGGGLAFLNILLDSEDFQARIKEKLNQTLAANAGLQVDIKQKFSISVFPSLQLHTSSVDISRLPGSNLPLREMRLAGADIELGLLSLLGGGVDIKTVNLQAVQAVLELPELGPDKLNLDLSRVQLSDFGAANGRASVAGRLLWGKNQAQADINLNLILQGETALIADFFPSTVQLALEGKPEITLGLEGKLEARGPLTRIDHWRRLEGLRAGGFKIKLAGLEAINNGDFSPANLSGTWDLQAQGELKPLLTWLGYQIAAPCKNFMLQVSARANGEHIDLPRLNLALDGVGFQSKAGLARSGQARIEGALELGQVNIDDYQLKPLSVAARAAAQAPPQTPPQTPAQAPPAGSPPKIAVILKDCLNRVQGEIMVSGRELTAAGLKFSSLKAEIKGKDGVWTVSPMSLQTLGGQINISAQVDARPEVPALNLSVQGADLQLPGLIPALRQGWVQSLQADLSAQASDNILAGVNGSGSWRLRDIAPAAGVLPPELAPLSGQLSLSRLSADFSVRQGIAGTSNLSGDGPNFKLAGRGSLNLPRQRVDMKATLSLPLGLKILGAAQIPLLLQGPLSSPEVALDAAELAKSIGGGLAGQLEGGTHNIEQGIGVIIRGLGR